MKRLFLVTLSLLLAFSLIGCGGGTESGGDAVSEEEQPQEVYDLTWSIAWPAEDIVNNQLAPWFVEQMKERTDGRVNITVYAGGELLTVPNTYEGVVTRIADMGTSRYASTPGRFPNMIGFEMPGMDYNNVYAANHVFNDLFQKYQPADAQDTHLLWIDSTGPGYLYTKKPVQKMADFKGMQIRGDGLVAEALTTLGATPVSIPITDVYLSLERNVINGTLDRFGGLQNYKHAEVTDYIIANRNIYTSSVFFNTMNLDVWNSLPEDIQQVFTEVSQEAIDKSAEIYWNFENDGLVTGKDQGMEVIYIDDAETQAWIDAMAPVKEKWIASVGSSFPAEEFIADMNALAEKYNAQYTERWPENLSKLFGPVPD